MMERNKINYIKAAFISNFYMLGSTKDEILDELDIAIAAAFGPSNRNFDRDDILRWGDRILDAVGVR